MKKILFAAATIGALAAPAMAEDIGVRVGPVGAGVTVGESIATMTAIGFASVP